MLRKLAVLLLGITVLVAGLMVVYYRIDGIPLPETAQFTRGDGFNMTEDRDGSLVFTPATPTGRGLLIMHGAVVKIRSYAKTAAFFAQRGYTVYLPAGPARMSIAAVDKATKRLPEFGLDDWYAIGHSMGGMASLQVVQRLPGLFRAVALWGTAIPQDFSDLDLPIIFLWGDQDGLLGPERFASARERLPAHTQYVTLPGGNHREFAMYSHQILDGEGTLGWAAQIDLANAATAAFFPTD